MQTNQQCILIAIDSTEQAEIALRSSYKLARLTGSKIVLFDVTGNDNSKRLEEFSKEATSKLSTPVEIIQSKADLVWDLKRIANDLDPIYLILGLSNKESKGNVIGKNVFKAIRDIKCPVLTVTGSIMKDEIKTIFLPLDLSKESREKVYHAIELAKTYNAEIRLSGIITTIDEEVENKILAYSNQVWKLIQSENIKCKIKTLRGKSATKLVIDYTQEIGCDLIVIVRQEELNGIYDWFTGVCDAERIMLESNIPVLSYHPIKRKDMTMFVK